MRNAAPDAHMDIANKLALMRTLLAVNIRRDDDGDTEDGRPPEGRSGTKHTNPARRVPSGPR
jgi:hypothetical protein